MSERLTIEDIKTILKRAEKRYQKRIPATSYMPVYCQLLSTMHREEKLRSALEWIARGRRPAQRKAIEVLASEYRDD